MLLISLILGIPLILALLAQLVKDNRTAGVINAVGHLAVAVCASALAVQTAGRPGFHAGSGLFYVDSLSSLFVMTIAIINLAAAVYSTGYVFDEVKEGFISPRKSRAYYSLFNIFAFTMFLVPVVNNLGMMWAAIELTTLVSAFLVGFHKSKTSIEAAWKYIIICSVGITLALLGIIFLYHTVSANGHIKSLNWTDILTVSSKLDPKTLKIAFIFVLVGFGTKAGLVPMHTWLPDAHSQAPAPISALLSGVLLKTSIYAILRFAIIVNKSIGSDFTGNLLLFFGLLSMGLAAGFILVQKDLKRLLAYSSVEHIGVIFTGFGIGGPAGVFAALLHAFNHAVTKSIMFFSAGSIVAKYGTNNMRLIRGAVNVMPFAGVMLILGAFALAGSPPFSIFISEILVLNAGIQSGSYFPVVLFLLFAAGVFGGLIFHVSKVVFGKPPEDIKATGENRSAKIAFALLIIPACVLGISMPQFFFKLIISAADVILRGV